MVILTRHRGFCLRCMTKNPDVDDYYTGEESLPDDAHILAAYDAVTAAFEQLDELDWKRNEIIRTHQHLEHAVEILEKTGIAE